jgi:hypothetical protein
MARVHTTPPRSISERSPRTPKPVHSPLVFMVKETRPERDAARDHPPRRRTRTEGSRP